MMLPADTLTRTAGGYTWEEKIQAGQMPACANRLGMIGWTTCGIRPTSSCRIPATAQSPKNDTPAWPMSGFRLPNNLAFSWTTRGPLFRISRCISALLSITRSLTMHHPFFLPDLRGNLSEQSCLFQGGAQLGTKDHRQGLTRNAGFLGSSHCMPSAESPPPLQFSHRRGHSLFGQLRLFIAPGYCRKWS